jgi:hypothetical protein
VAAGGERGVWDEPGIAGIQLIQIILCAFFHPLIFTCFSALRPVDGCVRKNKCADDKSFIVDSRGLFHEKKGRVHLP